MSNKEIDYEKKLAKTEAIANEIISIMENNRNYDNAKIKLESNVIEKREESKLRVAFVGQYSAGKSTIISALTGINDIKIDSDVATDATKDYEWGGVVITDTPGIGTDNIDHDEKTYELLKKADIIVYCLTYSLFNPESLANFLKIAYEKKYANKIMLVVNKMDSEQGVFPDLVRNYTETLRRQLSPHELDSFPISFIISAFELEDDMKQYSNFDDFREKLNLLIAKQDKFSQLESLTHVIIDTVQEGIIVADNTASNEEIKLGQTVENKYVRIKRDLTTQIFGQITQLKDDIFSLGMSLATKVGKEGGDFNTQIEQSREQITKWRNDTELFINDKYREAAEQIEAELEEISVSETFKSLSNLRFKDSTNSDTGYSTFTMINTNVGKGAKTVSKMSQGVNYTDGLLKASTASGSNTHNIVKLVGKQLGYKFKPWQAVNIAKNLGNVAKAAGPVVALVGMYVDYKSEQKEEEAYEAERNAQLQIKNSYIEIGNDMYRELKSNTDAVNAEVFDSQIAKIREERQAIISKNKNLDNTAKQMLDKVDELKQLIA